MARFYPLRVAEVRRETAECVSVRFDVPEALAATFAWRPGQHLTLRHEVDGEELRRTYSLCSAPHEGEWRIAIKKVEGGRFSTWANERLEPGMTLDVMPPMGSFVLPEDYHGKTFVAFAAGSGITPVMSMIKTALETDDTATFTLFYGNRTTDSVIFLEELEALKNKHLTRFALYHVLSREHPGADLFYGRLTPEKLMAFAGRLFQPETTDAFFLCGPGDMATALRQALVEQLEVPPARVHQELFTVPGQETRQPKVDTSKLAASAVITATLDGQTFDFPLSQKSETILDAALKAGADLPFACKGGVCCTCKARVLEGEVEMDVNYGLEPDQVEAGYVLTCQAHPLTPRVRISFDE
ncbi:MAG: phenylacetate-CoA oxygenase/reductase subunit PaaK [Bacteroidetes bacterium]|nr:MAG: phenylacetate-CoA oxygenase/reductase subunit PaaK [Bacteroidota bacterium]